MNITKNGVTIIVEDAVIERMVLERLGGEVHHEKRWGITIPRIGQYWHGQGGVYAGIARGGEGEPDYHLIVGPEAHEAAAWDWCQEWVKAVDVDGKHDFTLPFRREQALCFANVPELFKQECYWSCEQRASDSGNAWYQSFHNGGQSYWTKDHKLRARAFRRLIIR